MLLASLIYLEPIQSKIWRRMTESTRNNRLTFKMFNVGSLQGINRS